RGTSITRLPTSRCWLSRARSRHVAARSAGLCTVKVISAESAALASKEITWVLTRVLPPVSSSTYPQPAAMTAMTRAMTRYPRNPPLRRRADDNSSGVPRTGRSPAGSPAAPAAARSAASSLGIAESPWGLSSLCETIACEPSAPAGRGSEASGSLEANLFWKFEDTEESRECTVEADGRARASRRRVEQGRGDDGQVRRGGCGGPGGDLHGG